MNKIGSIIKSTRKAHGLTQRAFGETLTVSQSYISSVESGKETPTPMFIKLFCSLYSINENLFISRG